MEEKGEARHGLCDMKQSFDIEFTCYRCPHCRRYYQVEADEPADCGWCTKRLAEQLNARVRDLNDAAERTSLTHARTVSALKGAITKAKQR